MRCSHTYIASKTEPWVDLCIGCRKTRQEIIYEWAEYLRKLPEFVVIHLIGVEEWEALNQQTRDIMIARAKDILITLKEHGL